MLLVLLACADPEKSVVETGDTGGGDTATLGCADVTVDTLTAVVTDIDETLTTSDTEYLMQLGDPDHDPAMRPDANTLMVGYHARGYRVFYVTARGEDLPLSDGTASRDATRAWLDLHGFPIVSDADLFLSEGSGALGDDARDYKTGVIQGLLADGMNIVYAYGNADSDVQAYQAAGLADERDYLVGDLAEDAATYGVVGISNEDAYTAHMATQLPAVECAAFR